MARTVREAILATRSARLRLAVVSKPYWRVLEQGLHLGIAAARPAAPGLPAGAASAAPIMRPSSVWPTICRTPTAKQFLISRRRNVRLWEPCCRHCCLPRVSFSGPITHTSCRYRLRLSDKKRQCLSKGYRRRPSLPRALRRSPTIRWNVTAEKAFLFC
jgi:hypothetical protein